MARNRQSVVLPLLMGIFAILFTVAILVGWSIVFTNYYALRAQTREIPDLGTGYWIILAIGCVFLASTVAVLVLFLIANLRQIKIVRQQTTFIDSVTHELKSPLASIRLGLETLHLRSPTGEIREKLLKNMLTDVNRLQELIDHILEASRLELGQRELCFECIDPGELVEMCSARIHNRFPEQEIEIAVKSNVREVCCDRVVLETILLNLLENAVKYSPKGAQVTVGITSSERTLRIRVQDRGVGLARRHRKKIFQRFFRIQRPGVRGSGLGLYVVRSLLKRLGGSVKVRSDGEGCGSTFKIEIPLAPKDAREKGGGA